MNYCERCRVGLNRQRAARPHSWQLSRYDSLRMPRAAGRVERAHACNSSKFNVSADNRLVQCPLSAEADLEAANPSGRVEMWRGDGRSGIAVCRPFRLAVP